VITPTWLSNGVAITTSASRDIVVAVSPKATLEITASSSSPREVTLRLSGAPNQVYEIETSSDMVTWDWLQSVGSNSGQISFVVPIGNTTMQFFRARQ